MVELGEELAGAASRRSGTAEAATARRPRLGFLLLAAVQVVLVGAITVVSLALPTIQRDLGLTHTELALVSAGYGLSFSGLLLLGGRFADVLGHRRVFVAGTVVFGLASAAGALAPNLPVLLGARFGQGVGAAAAAPAAMALLNSIFPDPVARARAIGLWGGLSASGAIAGTFASGVVVTWVSWRWTFVAPAIVAAVAVASTPVLLPSGFRTATGARVDLISAVLATLGLSALSYGLLEAADRSGSPVGVLAPVAAGALLVLAFLARQARSDSPLLPLTFFSPAPRSAALGALVVTAAGFASTVFFLSLYFQQVRDLTPLQTTVAFLPTALVPVASAISGRLVVRLGARAVTTTGLAIAALALLVLGRVDTTTPYTGALLVGLTLLAAGAGTAFSGAMVAAVSGVPQEQAGLAGGVANTAVEVGPTVGLAVLVSIAAGRSARLADGGLDPATATTAGYGLALTIAGAGFAVVAVLAATLGPASTAARSTPQEGES